MSSHYSPSPFLYGRIPSELTHLSGFVGRNISLCTLLGSMYGVLLCSDAGVPFIVDIRVAADFLRAARVVNSSAVRIIWKSTYFSGIVEVPVVIVVVIESVVVVV